MVPSRSSEAGHNGINTGSATGSSSFLPGTMGPTVFGQQELFTGYSPRDWAENMSNQYRDTGTVRCCGHTAMSLLLC